MGKRRHREADLIRVIQITDSHLMAVPAAMVVSGIVDETFCAVVETVRVRHAAICLHHHPIDTDCQWMNETTVADADRLFAEIRQHEQVRAIIFGHVHREITQERGGVLLLGAPSTCHKFRPGTVEPQFDALLPGYRLLELHADGGIDTEVCRI